MAGWQNIQGGKMKINKDFIIRSLRYHATLAELTVKPEKEMYAELYRSLQEIILSIEKMLGIEKNENHKAD